MHATKRFLLLTSCAWCIAVTQAARADYFGLEVVDRTDLTICQDTTESYIPYKMDVCEIHVVLDDAADRLISTAFSNVSTTAQQGFFQHTLGGNTAPACAQIALEPTLECDSFITLGLECDRGGSTTDPDFDSTAFNNDGEVSGGWYNSAPSNGQGDPDANDRVMIARFSYKQNKNTSGDVCVFAKLAGSDDITAFLLEPFDCSVPGMQGGGSGGSGGVGGTICYVDDDKPQGNNCLGNWTKACPDLQTALSAASAGLCSQIWVAEGIYRPTTCGDPLPDCEDADRELSFDLLSDVAVYGGFDGTETTFAERTGLFNSTVLSGDIDQNDADFGDPLPGCDDLLFDCSDVVQGFVGANSYHVVNASGVSSTALLDGFYITRGLADGSPPHGTGAGINAVAGSPTVRNCSVALNRALQGGGVYLLNSTAVFEEQCCVALNVADFSDGGGFYIDGGTPTISDSAIYKNTAYAGGGIYSKFASPTIQSNDIVKNTVASNSATGAGIHIEGGAQGSSTTIDDNLIANGTGLTHLVGGPACQIIPNGEGPAIGAGIYIEDNSDVVISNNRIEDNGHINIPVIPPGGSKGGGVYCDNSSPLIQDNLFSGNVTALGGGIFNANNSDPQIVDCEFRHNGWVGTGHATRSGGAMYNEDSAPTVINCKFLDNAAGFSGGGGVVNWLSDPLMQPTFINCLFAHNDSVTAGFDHGGGAMRNIGGAPVLVNCTFGENHTDFRGGALQNLSETQVTLENCILWGDTALTPDDGDEIYIEKLAMVTVNWSDAEGGELAVQGPGTVVWGAGNIGEDLINHDPKYSAPTEGGFILLPTSACIDAGDNLAVPPGIDTDLDGLPRIVDDPDTDPTGVPFPGGDPDIIVDMGAFEVRDCGNCPTDVDDSGDTGPFDLATLLGFWGPLTNGDLRCLDADGDGQIGPFDLAFLLGAWGPC